MMLGAVLTYAFAQTLGWPMLAAIALALALCALYGLRGRGRRGAAVRAARLGRLADGHRRARHRARQCRDVHVRQGAAQPAVFRSPSRRSTSAASASASIRCSSLIPVVGLVLAALLQLHRPRTRWGVAMLAVVQNRDAARLMGIPIARVDRGRVRGVDAVRRRRRRADRAAVQRALRHGHAVRAQGLRGRDPRRNHQRVGRDDRRPHLRRRRGADHVALGSGYTQIITFALVIVALALRPRRPLRPRERQQGMTAAPRERRASDGAGARRSCSAGSPMAVAVGCRRGCVCVRRDQGQRVLRVRAGQRRADGDRRHRPQPADRPHGPGVVRSCRLLRDRRLRRRDPDHQGRLQLLAGVAARHAARWRRRAICSRSRRCG